MQCRCCSPHGLKLGHVVNVCLKEATCGVPLTTVQFNCGALEDEANTTHCTERVDNLFGVSNKRCDKHTCLLCLFKQSIIILECCRALHWQGTFDPTTCTFLYSCEHVGSTEICRPHRPQGRSYMWCDFLPQCNSIVVLLRISKIPNTSLNLCLVKQNIIIFECCSGLHWQGDTFDPRHAQFYTVANTSAQLRFCRPHPSQGLLRMQPDYREKRPVASPTAPSDERGKVNHQLIEDIKEQIASSCARAMLRLAQAVRRYGIW